MITLDPGHRYELRFAVRTGLPLERLLSEHGFRAESTRDDGPVPFCEDDPAAHVCTDKVRGDARFVRVVATWTRPTQDLATWDVNVDGLLLLEAAASSPTTQARHSLGWLAFAAGVGLLLVFGRPMRGHA